MPKNSNFVKPISTGLFLLWVLSGNLAAQDPSSMMFNSYPTHRKRMKSTIFPGWSSGTLKILDSFGFLFSFRWRHIYLGRIFWWFVRGGGFILFGYRAESSFFKGSRFNHFPSSPFFSGQNDECLWSRMN